MKHVNKLFVVVLMLVGSASVNAQNVATASATATIISPISIVRTGDMSFGNLAVDAVNGGSVILGTDGSRSVTGGVTLPGAPGTVSAAAFTVSGADGYAYSIAYSPFIILEHSGGVVSLMADTFTDNSTGVLTGGSENISVGATLYLMQGEQDGVYTTVDPLEVTVNYN